MSKLLKLLSVFVFVLYLNQATAQGEYDTLSLNSYTQLLEKLDGSNLESKEDLTSFYKDNGIHSIAHKSLLQGYYEYQNLQFDKSINTFLSLLEDPNTKFIEPIKSQVLFLLSASYDQIGASKMSLRAINEIYNLKESNFDPFKITLMKAIALASVDEIDSSNIYFEKSLGLAKEFIDTGFVYYNAALYSVKEESVQYGIEELQYIVSNHHGLNSLRDTTLVALCYNELVHLYSKQTDFEQAKQMNDSLEAFIDVTRFDRIFPRYLIQSIVIENELHGTTNKYSLLTEENYPIFRNEILFKIYVEMLKHEYKNPNYKLQNIIDSVAYYTELVRNEDLDVINEINDRYNNVLEDNSNKIKARYEQEELKNQALQKNNLFYKFIVILVILISILILFIVVTKFRNTRKAAAKKMKLLETNKQLSELSLEKQKLELELSTEKVKIRENDLRHLQELINVKTDVSKELVESLGKIKSKVKGEAQQEINQLLFSLKGVDDVQEEQLKLNKDSDLYSSEIRNKIAEKFPALSDTDVKLCNLLILGFDTKSIAKIRNVRTDTIHTSKYRIKKKMNLSKETNLDMYLRKTFN